MKTLVIAMKEEANPIIDNFGFKRTIKEGQEFYKREDETVLLVTGIGRKNVEKTMCAAILSGIIPPLPDVLNIGYAGGHKIKKGCILPVRFSKHIEYKELNFKLDIPAGMFASGAVDCYTAEEFVEKTSIKGPCLFDMELAHICRLPHKKISSIKVVSDNLDEKDFMRSLNEIPFEGLFSYIEKNIKEG